MSDEKVTIDVPLKFAQMCARWGSPQPSSAGEQELSEACRKAVEENEAQQREVERKQLEGWVAVNRAVARRGWMVDIPDQHGKQASTMVNRDGTSDFSELQAKTMAAAPEAFEALEAWEECDHLHRHYCGDLADRNKARRLSRVAQQKRRTGK